MHHILESKGDVGYLSIPKHCRPNHRAPQAMPQDKCQLEQVAACSGYWLKREPFLLTIDHPMDKFCHHQSDGMHVPIRIRSVT
jgi:hypothetical protein